jgi:hypothetical protein
LWLDAFGQCIKTIGGLVHPTPLFFGGGENVAQGSPKPERPVAHGQDGGGHAPVAQRALERSARIGARPRPRRTSLHSVTKYRIVPFCLGNLAVHYGTGTRWDAQRTSAHPSLGAIGAEMNAQCAARIRADLPCRGCQWQTMNLVPNYVSLSSP